MVRYKVVVAPRANEDMKRYVAYLANVKKSKQAAQALFDDYRKTKKRLADVAGMIKESDNEKIRARDLKRLNFDKHNYFLFFRVKNNTAEIVAIFHSLEDFENKLSDGL